MTNTNVNTPKTNGESAGKLEISALILAGLLFFGGAFLSFGSVVVAAMHTVPMLISGIVAMVFSGLLLEVSSNV